MGAPSASELRSLQAPIKEQYKSDPSTALVTLKSEGTLSNTAIACKLSTGAAVKEAQTKVAGLHPKAGGPDAAISGELCSGDMLLDALVACAGVTLKAVATALELPLKDGTVRAEGDLDFRGTLGVDRNAPVGFSAIRLNFDCKFNGEVEQSKVDSLLKLTERYCVVLQTIKATPELSATMIADGGGIEVMSRKDINSAGAVKHPDMASRGIDERVGIEDVARSTEA